MNYFENQAMSRSKLCDIDKMSEYKFYCKHIAKNMPVTSTSALNFGSAFHCAILEPNKFNDEFAVEPVVNKRTKAGKEELALFISENENKTIITPADKDMLDNMILSLSHHPALKILKSCDLVEEEFYFNLDLDFKAKLDAINTKKHIIFDVKTCRESFANGEEFAKEMINHHNAEQVYIYSEAYFNRFGVYPSFYFICIEKQFPFEVQIFDAGMLFDYGKIQTEKHIEKYKKCLQKYGDKPWITSKIVNADLPNWALNQIQ